MLAVRRTGGGGYNSDDDSISTSSHASSQRRRQHQRNKTKKKRNIGKEALKACKPTTVELCGIPVHFPFQPYECQKSYMSAVINALNHGENALLESPTGTGKTLCLLCATLAWRHERYRLLPQNNGGADNDGTIIGTDENNDSKTSDATEATAATRGVPTIIYASRTHSQISQVVRELRNTRYRPRHAVLGSREQMCVNPKVKTKTSTSSEINHGCNKLGKDRKCRFRNNLDGFTVPNNEGMCEGGAIGSSSNGNGNNGDNVLHQPVLDMEDLLTLGKKSSICPFYHTRNHIPDAEILFVPYNYLFDREARKTTLAEVKWEDSIIIFDEAHNLESFASDSASFDLSNVDIAGCMGEVSRAMGYLQAFPEMEGGVKMDNLLILKQVFMKLEDYLLNDSGGSFEGEYIFEIFRKGCNLTYANHHLMIELLRNIGDLFMDIRGGGGGGSGSANNVSSGTPKLDHFASCLKRVYGTSTEGQAMARARAYRVHISTKDQKQTHQKSSPSGNGGGSSGGGNGRTLSYWCFAPSLSMHELSSLSIRSILVTSGTLSPLPSYGLELGLNFPHTLENPHIISSEQVLVRVIGRGVSNKQLSSSYNRRDDGEYITELGNTIVSLARVVPGGILVFFPSYGVMENCIERWGGPVSSRNRFRGNTPSSFFAPRPKRNNASFSSGSNRYSFPHTPTSYGAATNGSAQSTPWKRLLQQKSIVLEPKSTADLKDAITEFEKFIETPKSSGCVLMGVCRGKISEGIDFADDKCRAVVITGLPFAPYLDPKVKLKREYLDQARASSFVKPSGEGGFGEIIEKKTTTSSSAENQAATTLSGAEWYTQQAHRAVNQAVGRVIRHRSDYGAVLLLDSRFDEPRNQLGLSKWLRPHIQKDEGVGVAIGSLVKFFRAAKARAEAKKKELDAELVGDRVGGRSIHLAYEDDDKDNTSTNGNNNTDDDEMLTKIAVIKTTTLPGNANSKNKQGRGDGAKEQLRPDISIRNGETNENKDENELLRGYVKPENVIKRMVIESTQACNDHSATMSDEEEEKGRDDIREPNNKQNRSAENTTSSSALAAVYSSSSAPKSHCPATSFLQRSFANTTKSSSFTPGKLKRRGDGPCNSLSETISSAWSGLEVKEAAKTATNMTISSTSSAASSREDTCRNTQQERLRKREARRMEQNAKNILHANSNKKNTATNNSRKQQPQQAVNHAKQFFDLAKRLLTSKDFSAVRNVLVKMKTFGDKKDAKSYMKSAHDLIELLIQYDDKSDENVSDPRLLELLFPLLPSKYRPSIEQMAVDIKFDQSAFHLKCKEVLQNNDYLLIKNTVTENLMSPKHKLSSPSSVSKSKYGKAYDGVVTPSYLKDTESVVKIVSKYGRDTKVQVTDLLEMFYVLLPPQFRKHAAAVAKQYLSALKVKMMKESDKKKRGEDSLNPLLFRKSAVNHYSKESKKTGASSIEPSSNSDNQIEERRHMEAALMRAEAIKRAMKDRVDDTLSQSRERVLKTNPYLAKQKNRQAPPSREKTSRQVPLLHHSIDRPKKRSRDCIGHEAASSSLRHKTGYEKDGPSLSTTQPAETKQAIDSNHDSEPLRKQLPSDPLERCLEKVKSDTFLKRTPRIVKIARRIKANVPEGFLCTICDSVPNKPFMADCGHSACFECWIQWLNKSGTCPICRVPTTKEGLARMVFEREAGAGVPSLSQMCASDEDESDNEALEFVKTEEGNNKDDCSS